MKTIPLTVAGLGRSGNAPIKQMKDQSRSIRNFFLSTCVKLTIRQVAVKALLLYSSDQVGGTIDKKSEVSATTKACIILSHTRGCHFVEDPA
jgi:hypothetical protein